jgi:glucans biosynthesis protein C
MNTRTVQRLFYLDWLRVLTILRLFIPLLVAVFTYAPLQVYLERITHGQFSGSFFAWLPHYFEGAYMDVGGAGNFAFAGMHMWYVMILLLYCVMFYPLFRWWKGSGRGVLDKITGILAAPWTMWLVMALPILILHIFVSDTDLEFGSGGWPFLYYILFLLYGFVIVSHERLQSNIQRMRWFHLTLGAVLGAVHAFLAVNVSNPVIEPWEDALGDTLWILSACNLLPAFLGIGMQNLTKATPLLKYASEAVMGFYILHQTVLLVVGYFVVTWAIPDFAKWAVIFVVSLAVIMAIYEFLIRRVNAVRWLSGMKPLKKVAVSNSVESKIAEIA